jgi:omega-6 fatty acid desaturase (delta-12 desaturase)
MTTTRVAAVTAETPAGPPAWTRLTAPYRGAVAWKSIYQLVNTLVLYFAGLFLCWLAYQWSFWLMLVVALPTGLLMTRAFVLQHDCGHGSFFNSRRANDTVGRLLGYLTFTPYEYWRKSHALHHATSGDLGSRGFGDIATLTLKEYYELSPKSRFGYWLYRHPIVMFGLFPFLLFVVRFRFHYRNERKFQKDRWSVYRTNFFLGLLIALGCFTVGWKAYFAIQLAVLLMGGTIGVWLFYVQHQYEDTYWAQPEEWNYFEAAILGSSHFRMPKVLQWFSGNIGIHHVHHLCPAIPNYKLQQAHDETPEFQVAPKIGLWTSIRSAWLAVWDEETRTLISFREARRRLAARGGAFSAG